MNVAACSWVPRPSPSGVCSRSTGPSSSRLVRKRSSRTGCCGRWSASPCCWPSRSAQRRCAPSCRTPVFAALMTAAGVLIGINWFTYIWGVNNGLRRRDGAGLLHQPAGQRAARRRGARRAGPARPVGRAGDRPARRAGAGSGGRQAAVHRPDPCVQLRELRADQEEGGSRADGGHHVRVAGAGAGCARLSRVGNRRRHRAVWSHSAWQVALLPTTGVVTALPLLLFAGSANRISLTRSDCCSTSPPHSSSSSESRCSTSRCHWPVGWDFSWCGWHSRSSPSSHSSYGAVVRRQGAPTNPRARTCSGDRPPPGESRRR